VSATAPEVGERLTPSGIYLGTWTPQDREWHAARKVALGGSEIAAVLGLSPWESQFSLWCRKRGEIAEQAENPEMEWGKRLEPVLLGKYLDNHPDFELGPCGTFVNSDRPWQLANPDGLLRRRDRPVPDVPFWLWEGTVSRDDIGWGDEGSDQVPVYYLAQFRWYLDVLGLPGGDMSVLIAGQDYREYTIQADPTDAATMRAAGAEFIRRLRDNDRPDLDAHGATYQAVRELHPDIDPEDVEIPLDLRNAYRDALLACKAADGVKSLTASQVLDAMGRARRAVCLGERVALRVPGRGDNPPFLRPDVALTKDPTGPISKETSTP
jgi:putative phage-type endonuclease